MGRKAKSSPCVDHVLGVRNLPKSVQKTIRKLPRMDRHLFSDIQIGEIHSEYGEAHGLWLGRAMAGGRMWLRGSWKPTKMGEITLLHEYGHYAWFFKVSDLQKRLFKKAFQRAKAWAKKEGKKREREDWGKPFYPYRSWQEVVLAGRAGRDVREAHAEAYAWFYQSKGMKELLKRKRPEMFRVISKIERQRRRNRR